MGGPVRALNDHIGEVGSCIITMRWGPLEGGRRPMDSEGEDLIGIQAFPGSNGCFFLESFCEGNMPVTLDEIQGGHKPILGAYWYLWMDRIWDFNSWYFFQEIDVIYLTGFPFPRLSHFIADHEYPLNHFIVPMPLGQELIIWPLEPGPGQTHQAGTPVLKYSGCRFRLERIVLAAFAPACPWVTVHIATQMPETLWKLGELLWLKTKQGD